MVSETGNFRPFGASVGSLYPQSQGGVFGAKVARGDLTASFDRSVVTVEELTASRSAVRGYLEAAYLSSGPRIQVAGVEGVEPMQASTCLHRVCAALGVLVPRDVCRVVDLTDDVLLELQSCSKFVRVFYDYTADDSETNHVDLVGLGTTSTRLVLSSPSSLDGAGFQSPTRYVGVTNPVQFFNKSNMFAGVMFFSGEHGGDDEFGADAPLPPDPALSFARASRSETFSSRPPREPSVADPTASHGGSNLSQGVVRPRRRVVASRSKFNPTGVTAKSYVSSSGIQFNNLNEIFLDVISRDYAQEILEQLFETWGVDGSDSNALKYAEDLVWAFIIATTASNKAAYNKEFEIPQAKGAIVVSFDVMSRILAEGHGISRRQFARGVADDMHRYIREPENLHLLPLLATRIGCDPQMAALAFDGSTHCTGLTSAEQSFTKLLERRNLFEDDSLLADGASQRLMQGMSSGPRSIITR